MKVLIVGAGVVGTYIGTKLNTIVEVDVLCKTIPKYDGVEINSERYFAPNHIDKISKQYDLGIIATKAYDVDGALQLIENNCSTIVIVQSLLRKVNAVRSVILEGYTKKGNKISKEGNGGWCVENSLKGRVFAELLRKAEIKVVLHKSILEMIAKKILFLAPDAALSVIVNKTLQELCYNTSDWMNKIFDETYEVLRTAGLIIEDREKLRTEFYTLMKSMDHYPSMYHDFHLRRKTEIDFVNGTVIEIGREVGVATPCNKQIMDLFKRYGRK